MVDWADALSELIGFVGSFLAIGAIGFRYAIVPRWNVTETDGTIRRDALHRAAIAGVSGAAITLLLAGRQAMHANAQQRGGALIGAFLALLAAGGFLFAIARVGFGWMLAAVGVVLGAFQPALTGKWSRLINPTHRFFAAMWIGTLFVIVVAGLTTILRDTSASVERGRIARDLIAVFSPLALLSFAILAFFGMWTAWKHLKRVDALWTTPYGDILIAKLVFVGGVMALGAWNWRRQRPLMGSEAAATSLKRSATWELAVAGIVLVITAVLISVPSPR